MAKLKIAERDAARCSLIRVETVGDQVIIACVAGIEISEFPMVSSRLDRNGVVGSSNLIKRHSIDCQRPVISGFGADNGVGVDDIRQVVAGYGGASD